MTQSWLKKVNSTWDFDELILGIVLFTLPLSINLNSISILIAILYFSASGNLKNFLKDQKWFIVGYACFFIQSISFLLSDNMAEAEKKIILFLPFLVFPIMFRNINRISRIEGHKLFLYLAAGLTLALIKATIFYGYDILILGERFDYGRGVNLMLRYLPHHVYFSIYTLISVLSIAYAVGKGKLSKYFLLFIPVFYIVLFYLPSRVAILFSLTIAPVFIVRFLRTRFSLRSLVSTTIISLLGVLVIGMSIKFSRDKILHTYFELANIESKEKPFRGVSFRKKIWTYTFEAIKEKPITGYGIGDTQQILNDIYLENDEDELMNLNAHNQYLQSMLFYGIPITLIILTMFGRIIFNIAIRRHELYAASWIILILFSMTESLLNRHWGVVFFVYILYLSCATIASETRE